MTTLKVIALAFALVLVGAAPAQAWTNPLLVSLPDTEAVAHAIGIDGAGDAVVVVLQASGGIFVTTRGADETVSEPLRINAGHGQQPGIATNPAGVSAVTWVETDGRDTLLHLRIRRADGSWTADKVVSPGGADATAAQPAIDDAGNVVVTWLTGDETSSRIYVRTRSVTGSLGPIRSVSPATGHNVTPRIAVTPAGDAFITWVRHDPGVSSIIVFGRALSSSGTLSATADMTHGLVPAVFSDYSLSLDDSGRALVAWTDATAERVFARTRTAAGTLSAVIAVSAAQRAGDVPATAAGRGGTTTTVAWTANLPSGESRVQSRRLVGAGWQPTETLTPASVDAANLVIDQSAGGARTIFVFTSFESGGTVVRLRAVERRADGSVGPLSILSADNGMGGVAPDLAVNTSGQAAAAWSARLSTTGPDLVWAGTNFLS